jgi:hypothetical protein
MLVNMKPARILDNLKCVARGTYVLLLTAREGDPPKLQKHALMAYRINSKEVFPLDVRSSEILAVSAIAYVAAAAFGNELVIWLTDKPSKPSEATPSFRRTFDAPITAVALDRDGGQCAVLVGTQLFIFKTTELETKAHAANLQVKGSVTKLEFFGIDHLLLETHETTMLYGIGKV